MPSVARGTHAVPPAVPFPMPPFPMLTRALAPPCAHVIDVHFCMSLLYHTRAVMRRRGLAGLAKGLAASLSSPSPLLHTGLLAALAATGLSMPKPGRSPPASSLPCIPHPEPDTFLRPRLRAACRRFASRRQAAHGSPSFARSIDARGLLHDSYVNYVHPGSRADCDACVICVLCETA